MNHKRVIIILLYLCDILSQALSLFACSIFTVHFFSLFLQIIVRLNFQLGVHVVSVHQLYQMCSICQVGITLNLGDNHNFQTASHFFGVRLTISHSTSMLSFPVPFLVSIKIFWENIAIAILCNSGNQLLHR